MNTEGVVVIVTTISTAVTALIPIAAKFTASRSEAVKVAAMTRAEDVELLRDLLKRCREEKAELVKLLTESGIDKGPKVA